MGSINITYLLEAEQLTFSELINKTGLSAVQLKNLPAGLFTTQRNGRYQLAYVGLIATNHRLVVSLPKYLAEREEAGWLAEGQTYRDEARLIMQVLRLHNKNLENWIHSSDVEDETTDFNGEPLTALNLIDHFKEYSYWYKSELVLVAGEAGEINWQKTIQQTIPLISDGNVLYSDVYSYRRFSYNESLILQIQRWAVRYCIEKYRDLLPEFNNVQYDTEAVNEFDDLGSKEYLTSVLEHELRISYRDSDIILLRLLIQLLNDQSGEEEEFVQLYGTTAFHVVWEKACKVAFGDQTSNLPEIPTPEWLSRDKLLFINSKNRMVPDIVWHNKQHLLILDAKYFNVKFKGSQVLDNPGITDVTKQVIYFDMVSSLLKLDQPISLNAFVLPRSDGHGQTESQNDWLWGCIDTKIPLAGGKQIAVLLVPPHEVFRSYLAQKVMIDHRNFIKRIIDIMP